MREVGRNDPCPCGSGRKHKRCCLDLERAAQRLGARLEERILELGDETRERAHDAWVAQFERHIGPIGRLRNVHADEAAWLDTWLVCDARVIDGRSPLDATSVPSHVDEQLRHSAICGWWARGSNFPLPATHWRFEEPLTLHSAHEPFGELDEGTLLIARGVATGGGHIALIARPIAVDPDAVDDILALLNTAPDLTLCAALRWPEEREHTAEGELVQQCFRRHQLSDPQAAITILRKAAGAVEQPDVMTYWEDDVLFHIAGDPIVEVAHPPHEPGIVWELCREDTELPRRLGEVTVSPTDGELTLSTPTKNRAERLLAALPAELRASLGEVTDEDLDAPDVLPRVRRERLASLL
jgi:SEC-C motif-containing protein